MSFEEHDEMSPTTDSFFSSLPGAMQTKFHDVGSRAGKVAGPGDQTQTATLWLELGLCKALARAVVHMGFFSPTPVQVKAIPAILRGNDCCVRAVTGSGKTAAFLLPVLHTLLVAPSKASRKKTRVVVIVPSRELGIQCEAMARQFLLFTTGITVGLAVGGTSRAAQDAVIDSAPTILIVTPGRFVDVLLNSTSADTSGVEVVVMDECDKLLTPVLKEQVKEILSHCPQLHRQTLMFSATMTQDVDAFAKEMLVKPTDINIGHVALQSQLKQEFIRVCVDRTSNTNSDNTKIKTQHLLAFCRHHIQKTIIFAKYKSTVHRLAVVFQLLGMRASELQSTQSQEEREKSLKGFAAGDVDFLFCTDVASRGLDIPNVAAVINFDMPPALTSYIHRVGRTARIGAQGVAISLVDDVEDAEIMKKVLAISHATSEHHLASVKRRVLTEESLQTAKDDLEKVFPLVKEQLAAEELEERIREAEKKLGGSAAAESAVEGAALKTPRRKWCMSKAERETHEKEAKERLAHQSEIPAETLQELQQAERDEGKFLRRQKNERKRARQAKEETKEKERETRKAQRKEASKMLERGALKKAKQAKIRAARKEERSEKAGKKHVKPQKNKKEHTPMKRHRGRQKKH